MKTTLLITVAAVVPLLVAAADAPLFTYTARFDAVGGGGGSVTFEEISRTPMLSLVRVSGRAPISGLQDRFLALAICGLAKARSESHFQLKQVAGEPQTFEVSFPKVGPSKDDPGPLPASAAAPSVYPVSACP